MGGSLGGIFSGTPQGTDSNGKPAPSTGQKIAQGLLANGALGLSQGLKQQPQQGGGAPIGVVAPTPVDPSFFAPTKFGQGSPTSSLYGG